MQFFEFFSRIIIPERLNYTCMQVRPRHLLIRSLALEGVVDLLELLFALWIAQNISSLKKYGSVFLEFNRNGVELPIINKVFHEILHFFIQVCENFCRCVFIDRLKNFWFQLLPGQWLIGSRLTTHAGSRLTCAGSRLVRRLGRILLHCIASGHIIYPIGLLVPQFSCVRAFLFFLVSMPIISLVLVY